jgi:iron complex transport system ATP-binding protein
MTTSSSPAFLDVIDLTLEIENRLLCRSLSMSMSEGETWSVLGPNGSGKTTLLETLAGLRPASSGEILLGGEPVSSLRHRELALRRCMLFQNIEDAFPATVMETVLSGRHPHIPYLQTETAADYMIARQALHDVDLGDFEDRDILSLSGGERQRVSIAACLTQNTPVRLFDEPTNHLDLKHQNNILQLLCDNHRRLNLVVLQDINQAWRYTSHALLLFPDGSTEFGTVDEMLTTDRLEVLYGCRLKIIQQNDDRVVIHC